MRIFAATRISSGPRCTVLMWIMRSLSPSSIAARIFAKSSGEAASPKIRDFISTARNTAIKTNRIPIARVPNASHRPLPVNRVRPTPKSAKIRPSSAPASSSRSTGSSGFFEVRKKRIQLCLPFSSRDSFTATRNELPSSRIEPTRTATGTHCHSVIPCGSCSFS